MHAILVSIGTDGDIFPYVGLGDKLQSRGHRITLVASEDYESLADTHGFAFQPLVSAAENHALFGNPDFWNPLKTVKLSARWGVRFIARQYHLLSSIVRPDSLLIANPGVFAAGLVHEKAGVPMASLVLQPGTIPSSIAPPIMPGVTFLRRAPSFVWKLFWLGLDGVGAALIGGELNRLRAALGLRPMRRIFQNWLSRQLALGLFPDWYAQPQPDWPPQLRLTGFPTFDGIQGTVLAPELAEFCRSAPPPIAFTFGTGMAHPGEAFRAASEACALLGRHGIFLTKYRDQLPAGLPDSIWHCTFAPFQRLFPLCAAVVHHGGIGTVAKAMIAGRPQLVYPFCFDQFDNGARLQKLGVGDCLKPGQMDGRRMADALSKLLAPESELQCQKMAQKFFDAPDAFDIATQAIEELAARGSQK